MIAIPIISSLLTASAWDLLSSSCTFLLYRYGPIPNVKKAAVISSIIWLASAFTCFCHCLSFSPFTIEQM